MLNCNPFIFLQITIQYLHYLKKERNDQNDEVCALKFVLSGEFFQSLSVLSPCRCLETGLQPACVNLTSLPLVTNIVTDKHFDQLLLLFPTVLPPSQPFKQQITLCSHKCQQLHPAQMCVFLQAPKNKRMLPKCNTV